MRKKSKRTLVFEKSHELHNIANKIRGPVLSAVAALDLDISTIITKYFSRPKRRDLFFSEIATNPSISFQFKLRLLKTIMIDCLSEEDYAEYKGILKKLDEIRVLRNKLAHAAFDVSEINIEDEDDIQGIGLLFYKDGKKQVEYMDLYTAQVDHGHLIFSAFSELQAVKRLIRYS